MKTLGIYREIWAVDFEFTARPGARPIPLCVVAREVKSGKLIRQWLAGEKSPAPPYTTDSDVLFVAYYASAELGCHLALGWNIPSRILDLFAEFRNLTNGDNPLFGSSLLGAMSHFGLDSIGIAEKNEMRDLAIRGGPFTTLERDSLVDYCQSDVDSLVVLLREMSPKLDLPRALLRGRYMAAVARMESIGIPLDEGMLARLNQHWDFLKSQLVREVDRQYGVYFHAGTQTLAYPPSVQFEMTKPAFNAARFADYLRRNHILWPTLPSGALALDDDTFRDMAKLHPCEIGPMRELRSTLGQLKLNDLEVGPDGRNRCLLSAFRSTTGRNQPSNSKFAFGPAAWFRSLIKPSPGRALAYVDWSQQELAIAAALSKDPKMMEAYRSGDFYLTFAKMAKAAPPEATKQSHALVREQFKTVSLGVLFGLSASGLARKLGVSESRGRELLELHRKTFRTFWEWSDAIEAEAMLAGRLTTEFGWRVLVGKDANPRSMRNFPMQANGAEMMRLAACLATEAGVRVCAPIHDAFLIEASLEEIENETLRMQRFMQEASEIVLPGFPLKTDAKIVRYPDRYSDPRGEKMWSTVTQILDAI